MDHQKKNPLRSVGLMGIALTFPFILAGDPVAGYFISQHLLVKQLGMSKATVPILTLLGFIGSGIQVIRLIDKVRQLDSKKNQR